MHALGGVKLAEAVFQVLCIRTDLAGEQVILREQQVILVVVEADRHAVVGEHQEGQGAGLDFSFGHQMPDDGLEERLVRDP